MKLFATCYRALEGRRRRLLAVLIMLLLLASCLLPGLKIGDSIVAMLPDGDSRVVRDFKLLQQTPFARKLVILVSAQDEISETELLAATRRLATLLPPELFHNLQTGPGRLENFRLLGQLGERLAPLADEQDLQQIAGRLTPAGVDKQMADNFATLLQPQGMAFKEQLRRDPLGLAQLALAKLRYINPLPGVRIEDGQFLSHDRKSSLLLADTDILITDPVGSRKLLDAFVLARAGLPAGISADLLSGHPYTLANTEVIKGDMNRVLLLSGCGLLLVFLVFLRRLQALTVFLLPFASMLLALVTTSFFFPQLSGITIGFGAVLLGITIDFGLHVYFALRQEQNGRAELLQAVSRPVLFGGLTTLAAFAVLLRSELPGQRQLAVFAVVGIIVALLLALLVLPHFVGRKQELPILPRGRRSVYDRHPRLRIMVLLLWLLLMGASAILAQGVRINGELRKLSYVPPELSQAEQQLAVHWGNLRGRAMIFATGSDLQQALQLNEQVWQVLAREQVSADVVSLAPLLPSRQRQLQQREQWRIFWQQKEPLAQTLLQQSGAKFGFKAAAFAPFAEYVGRLPEPVSVELLQTWGLGALLDNFIMAEPNQVRVLTLIPDRPELIAGLEEKLAGLTGVTLVSQQRFSRQLGAAIAADFSQFMSAAGITILVLLIVLFRRGSDVLLALLPVLSGILFMFGAMAWLGLELNLFNVVASILLMGLGVDYGIFMACHSRQHQNLASVQAVLVSGLTTLVGFGALVLARHPSLNSIGLTVLLGIGAAVPTAILVIPALRIRRVQ